MVEGVRRSFVLQVPADYDRFTAHPLIYAWHGQSGSGQKAQTRFGLQAAVGSEAVIVYPDALPLDQIDHPTGWIYDPQGRDYQLFDALHDYLRASLCIDDARVFSTGWSRGGYFTHGLGCHRGDRLTAIAAVAGGQRSSADDCRGAVAVWIAHGRADESVDFSEGEAALAFWRQRSMCGANSSATGQQACEQVADCRAPVHWCPHPEGHPWPSWAGASIGEFFSSQSQL